MENNQIAKTTNSEIVEPINTTMQVLINEVATESRADKIALINALDTADDKIVDHVGEILEIKGVYAETHFSNKRQENVSRCILIDVNGKSYATGSMIFINSLRSIIDVLGSPSQSEPLKIQIVEVAMEKGNALKAKVIE